MVIGDGDEPRYLNISPAVVTGHNISTIFWSLASSAYHSAGTPKASVSGSLPSSATKQEAVSLHPILAAVISGGLPL